MTTLYSYQAQEITLSEAIKTCQNQLKGAIALLYSPSACQFLRLIDGVFHDSHDRKINHLADVFEARIFNEQCELRWLNYDGGIGQAALLLETELRSSINQFKGLDPKKDVEPWDQQYLLWGEKANSKPTQQGWQRLAEARIGKIDVPIDSEIKDRVYLKTREYMAAVDTYGNYAVIEERLVKLEVK
jgi:CRISPR-associated protein (TIGR03984 family)